MATPFEDFINREMPRRPVMLTVDLTGYDGDPNAGGAPAIVSGAPKGSLYLRDSTTRLYQKTTSAAGTYVDLVSNDEYQSAITLAVSTTGNDSDPTRPARIVGGDWTTKPFATIQAAITSLPKLLRNVFTPAVINVAAGSYVGFTLQGLSISLKIQGVRQAATLATGPNSGTATSGSGPTLTLTGAGWTADNLVCRYLAITAGPGAGQIMAIAKNTTDTITLAGDASPTLGVGSVFTIEDPATFISSNTPGSFYPCYLSAFASVRVSITDIAVNAPTSFHFVYNSTSGDAQLTRCRADNASFCGFFIGLGSAWATFDNCIAKSCLQGFYCQGSQATAMFSTLAYGGSYGYLFYLVAGVHISSTETTIRGCSVAGLYAEGGGYLNFHGLKIRDCGTGMDLLATTLRSSGLTIENCSNRTTRLTLSALHLYGPVDGSGNAGFGLNAKGAGNVISLASNTPTITGAAGDATVDGTTPLTWAGSFGTPDTYAVDVASGARIYRS